MSYLKVIVLSAAGFAIPIVAALLFGPKIFKATAAPLPHELAAYNRGSLSSPVVVAADTDRTVPAAQEPQAVFRSISSDDTLDPKPNRYFLVSVNFKINNLPKNGRRQRLVSKYAGKDSPFPGWGIAIRRLSTSTRPEVYWQDKNGDGGWYSFDNVRFERNAWYTLTLVARDGDLMSLYLEQLTKRPAAADVMVTESGDEVEDQSEFNGVRFIGGYNLSGFSISPTAAAFEFSPAIDEAGEFRGEMGNILLAQPEKVPFNQDKLKEFLAGGASEIANRLDHAEVSLLIDDSGRDQSAAQRYCQFDITILAWLLVNGLPNIIGVGHMSAWSLFSA